MKAIFLILCLIASVVVIPVQAQTTAEFGYQVHPEKILENTQGTLQVFVTSNEMMVPKQIGNLKAVSSDNSIIQILGIEDGNDKFTKNVIINAKKPGITTIALAAPGFSSKEISLEVFNNNNHPTQLLMKITPGIFPIDGPRTGNIAVEIATTGGLPTVAQEDVKIHLDTPNKNVIKLTNSDVVIHSGQYYVLTEFEIIGSGDAIVFAETEGMKKISSIVNVLEAKRPLTLQLSVFPDHFNSFSGTTGFAIVQLVDGEGIPVISEEDIQIKLGVENPDNSINTSHDFEEIIFDKKQITIPKGSYSTYTKFSPRPNIGEFTEKFEQSYNMFISASNYLTKGDSFVVYHDQIGALEGEGPSITNSLPFLTTGKKEIIAVTYYETDIEVSRQIGGSTGGTTNRQLVTVSVPVQAKSDHQVSFSSSELDTVTPIPPIMKKGENAVLVFGDTGTVAPPDGMSFYITDKDGMEAVAAYAVGPIKDDMELIVEPLVPMILAESDFPSIAYLVELAADDEEATATTEDEETEIDPRLGITPFIEDSVLTFSANDYVDVDSISIKRNQPYTQINMISNEVSSTELTYQMSGFNGTTNIISHTTDPAGIHLSYQKNVLANSNTLATVQLVDSAGNPVYAKKDVDIKLVSNDEGVLKIPQELMIKKGDYFTTFEVEALEEGSIELALLSEDFTLSKYDINVIDITPVLSLDLIGTMNWNERIEAKLSVTIPEIQTSLNGFSVEWNVVGGEAVQSDDVTDSNGVAKMNVIANDKDTVTITATISGNGLNSATLTKTATILNIPMEEEVEETSESSLLPLDTNTMIYIIIPVGIGAAIFFLKRTNRLEEITEKIGMADKIEEIKERISNIRNR